MRSAARRELAGRDASGRRPPHTAPARAAPQPVPLARVPGPFPHRAGSRGHADGARMPHRGRELRGAGAHHLGPRAPLLPFLGRLLGECLRRWRGPGPGAAVAGTRPAPSGGADARVWQLRLGCSFQVRAGELRGPSRVALPLQHAAPGVTFPREKGPGALPSPPGGER